MTRSALSLLSRKQRKWLSIMVFVASVVIYFGQQQGWFGTIKTAAEVNQPGLYTVVKYDDGDTIMIDMNGTTETLRFVGVDTPETHDPRKTVQCYGPEASAYTKKLISEAGGKVRLASDPESTNRDRYDRLLRYIYLPDGRLVQDELLKTGHAFYYPYFPFTKSDQFKAEADAARQSKIGLWANCHPAATDGGGYNSNTQGT
ncbi:thermonuclease family protein [Aeromicrobium sp.]|nr:thermonuclease family protein [Candidatus Saccharibacteria bacterium]